MFDMFIDLVSDDALASAMVSLAEKFQCTPLDMLNTGCLFLCFSAFICGVLFITIIDRLIDKAILLLEKFGPFLVRFIMGKLTVFYLFLCRKLTR